MSIRIDDLIISGPEVAKGFNYKLIISGKLLGKKVVPFIRLKMVTACPLVTIDIDESEAVELIAHLQKVFTGV